MNVIRTRLHVLVAPDGSVSGHAPPTVPPGEHEAEIATQGLPDPMEKARLFEFVRALQDEIASLPVLDLRSPDEVIGYDENGLPR